MLSNRSFPSIWDENLGVKHKHSPFPRNPGEFNMDTFRAAQMKHAQDYNPCRGEIPLDLTLLNKTVPTVERDADSPLDLSLKTRKRCADTTDTDEDIIFLDQRYPAKRSCSEKGKAATLNPKSENTNDWYVTGSIKAQTSPCVYRPLYNSSGQETPSSESPFRQGYDPRPIPFSYNAQHVPVTHTPQQDQRGPQHIPAPNSRKYQTLPAQNGNVPPARHRDFPRSGQRTNPLSDYGSSSANPSLNVAPSNSPGHNGHHAPTHPRQLYSPQSYPNYHAPRNRATHAQFSQGLPSSCITTGVTNVYKDTRSPSGMLPKTIPFNGPLSDDPRALGPFHDQSRPSELRAALSSKDRYFPRHTPMFSTSVSSQRCSPDSTFPVTSVHVQKSAVPVSLSPVVTVTSVSGLCGAEVTSKPHHPLPPRTITGMGPPCSMGGAKSPKTWTQSLVSKSKSNHGQTFPGTDRTAGFTEPTITTKNDKARSMLSVVEVSKPPCAANNIPNSIYNTPLSISIPTDAKLTKQQTSANPAKREESKSFSRNPKLTCKKHIILNAVNQDEDLKMLTIPALTRSPPVCSSDPCSPSDQPPSPKMPILSPQHQIPLPLYSPLINDPPSLEPTPSTRGKDDNRLSVPDGFGAHGFRNGPVSAAAVVPPMRRADDQLSRLAPGMPALDGASNHKLNGAVGFVEENKCSIPNIPNLSAFVQTPNGKISPVRLKYKPGIQTDTERTASAADDSEHSDDIFGGSCLISPKKNKLTDWRSGHRTTAAATTKLIPVANVAPMVHTILNEDSKDINALDDSSKSSEAGDSKVVDIQAELAAYKSSLRMPAKLMPKSSESTGGPEAKRTGIAEKFGASESRFRHINAGKRLTNLRAIYGKLFGAKELSKCHQNTESSTPSSETDDKSTRKERNIWQSISEPAEGVESLADNDLFTDGVQDCVNECDETNSGENENVTKAMSPERQYPRLKRVRPIMKTFPGRKNGQKRTETPTKFRLRRSPIQNCSERGYGPRRDCCDDSECPKTGSSFNCVKLQKRHRRSMLDEIANSDGYVAERRTEEKPPTVDLFADPALLSREERALQKAMMRFTEMETGGMKRTRRMQQKQQSSSRQRADQLKRKALRHSPQKKGNRARGQKHQISPQKKGFVDFQPEVLESRTRMQSKGCHSVGGYNRDAAYENELKNDERRRELKRARRMAHQMAHQRAAVRKIHREQNIEERKLRETPKQREPEVSDCKETTTINSPRTSRLQKLREQSREVKTELTFEKPVARDTKKKEQLPLHPIDELPDLVEEIKTADTDGCWEVRNLASSDSLSQTLRSGRKKGGILMKLSWRPTTASSKGKPRIAHARVSSAKGRGPKSVRMLQLRRRAKIAYMQATHRTKRACVSKTRKISGPRKNIKVTKRTGPKSTRYPLRDLTPKIDSRVKKERQVQPEAEDGNTTEEYELEDIVEEEEFRAYSDDDSVYDDALQVENDDQPFDGLTEYPEPPELRKLNLNVNKNSGETPLHRAARLGYEDVVQYCLQSQMVDVNARDNAGYTALHECCVGGHISIARHLLSHGANPNCCSHDGVRPIQGPVDNNNVGIVRLLLSYGADQLLAVMDNDHSREMSNLLNGYLGDINGYARFRSEVPWEFYGSAVLEEESGVDHNLFSSVPSDEEDEDIDSLFQWSEGEPLVSYMIKVPEADSEDNYVILSHALRKYEMTRPTFLREFGPTIRIYSLSRYALEEDVMHSSTICSPLLLELQSQTVELIRLDDRDILEARKRAPGKGKQSARKRRTGNGYKRVKRRIFDNLVDCESVGSSLDDTPETSGFHETRTFENDRSPWPADGINQEGCDIPTAEKFWSDKNDNCLRSESRGDQRLLESLRPRCAGDENEISQPLVYKEKPSEQSRRIPELMSSTDRLQKTLNELVSAGLVYKHGKVEHTKDHVSTEYIHSVKEVRGMELDLVNNNNNKSAEISLLDKTPTGPLDISDRLLEIDR